MGIAEWFGRITAGKSSDYGARPSKEQDRVIQRTQAALDEAKEKFREWLRAEKKKAKDSGTVFRYNPPPRAVCSGTHSSKHGSGREDLLGAMRGLDPTSTSFIMYRYAQDDSSFPDVLRFIWDAAVDLHIQMDWRLPRKDPKSKPEDAGKEVIKAMCRLALYELTEPKCQKCHGTRYGKNNGYCRPCKGSGLMRITDKDRSTALRLSYHSFRDTYRHRYIAVFGLVKRLANAIDQNAVQLIHKNLYGE
jgi:hypothetical protein